jgi:arylsulfatase A
MYRFTWQIPIVVGFILLGALRPGSADAVLPTTSPSTKPNIIFILADDLGIDGLACYGADRFKGKTSNLDALAAGGTRFLRCYSTPVCGPSRCEIITGRYPFRTGALSNGSAKNPSPTQEPSVARILKQAGYVTGQAGKWHQMGHTPGDWGFDEYMMSDAAQGPSRVTKYTVDGKVVAKPKEQFAPDAHQKFAIDFVRRHRNEPFFFYYPSHLVHDPIVPTPDSKPGEADRHQLYDDDVMYLDKQVGELVAELDKLGLRQNTIILFSGDNGTDAGDRSSTIGGRLLHDGKRSMWEGGSRVPLIVNCPGIVPAGRVLNDLTDFSDFLPTFAELAGAPPPTGMKVDGQSFASQLLGRVAKPREWVFVQYFPDADRGSGRQAGRYYVRDDGWKLNESGELFDMSDAPFTEKLTPMSSHNATAAAERKRLQSVLDELNAAGGKTEPLPKRHAAAPAD